MLPGLAGGGLDGGYDDPQHIDGAAQLLTITWQPGLLQPSQGDGAGGVAGQHDQAGPLVEQADTALAGETHDLFAGLGRPP